MLQVHVLVRKIHKDHQKMCKNLTGCSKSSPEYLRDELKTMTSGKTNFILIPRVLKLNIQQARICMQFGCSHTCVHVVCVGCCYMLRHLLIRKTDKVSLIWPHKTVWPKNDTFPPNAVMTGCLMALASKIVLSQRVQCEVPYSYGLLQHESPDERERERESVINAL